MIPQTIKDIFAIGTLAGFVTVLSAEMILKKSEPPPAVKRLERISTLMNQPNYSLKEISYFEPSDLDKVKNSYNTLLAEKNELIRGGVEDELHNYENEVAVRSKRWRKQIGIGSLIILAGGAGLLWYKPKKREEDEVKPSA